MENVSSLIEEIDALVTNPSENALKSFDYFLQTENIGKVELRVWAVTKSCQIVPLATVVIEHTTGLLVFRHLAKLPEFVNAVLEVRPSWLESFLDKTTASALSSSSPGNLIDCASLVLHDTLKHGVFPASTLQLIQAAALSVIQRPNEESLRHLSQLIRAISNNVLEYFTDKLLTALSSQCKEVCSGSIKISEGIGIMLAQEILAQLAIAFQTPQTPSKSSVETPPGAKFSEGCRKRVFRLFSNPNASTTIKLTVLRLSVFCSEEHGSASLVALEGIRLARRIIGPISLPVRRQWAEENSKLVEKFLSRLGREALDLNLRLKGVVFCVFLLGAENEVPLSLKKVANAALITLCDSKSGYDSAIAPRDDKAIADVLGCLCTPMASPDFVVPGKTATVMGMISFIAEQCQPWCTNAVNTVLKLHRAKLVLDSLHTAVYRSCVLSCIIEFIQLGYVPEWWDSEVTFPSSLENSGIENCKGEAVCSKSTDRLRLELAKGFSSLLLKAAWRSSMPLQHPETCQRLLNRLKGSSLRALDSPCSYSVDQIMDREGARALTQVQVDCEEIYARLENETAQRINLEGELARQLKLVEENRQASNTIQQHWSALTEAQRECKELCVRLEYEKAQRVSLDDQVARISKLLEKEQQASIALQQSCTALTEAQTKCEDVRANLEKERDQRKGLENQLAQTAKLLEEERDASQALELYLKSSECECLEAVNALRSSREDYKELLADADRNMRALELKESEWLHYDLLRRADFLRREMGLEEEVKTLGTILEQKDEELRLEKQSRSEHGTEMQAALTQSNGQIEELRLAVTEKSKALEEAEYLKTRLMALLGERAD